MPTRDIYHDTVKQALIQDGWNILKENYELNYGGDSLYPDRAMDPLNHYRELIQKVLQDYYNLESANPHLESALLLDPIHDHYLLLRMGWHGNQRIKRNTIHIRLKDQKIWIEEDCTEAGVATDLLQLGVPRSDIVLAFHPPQLRQHTEFAIA
jgi:hypothetical protein